jgi:hypothetical protein
MYGVVASIPLGAGDEGTPEWVPEGALAHLDFVEGQYYSDGSTWTVSQLLGGGFDAGDIDANGMACWYTNTNRPNAAGSFLAVLEAGLASGMTIVVEINSPTEEAGSSPLLIFLDNTDANSALWATYIEHPAHSGSGSYQSDFGSMLVDGVFASRTETGTNRFGYTVGRDLGGGSWRFAASVNGDAAVSDDEAYSADDGFATAGVARVAIGAVEEFGWAFDQSYIRSITVYAAVDEAALAVLTEIPTA